MPNPEAGDEKMVQFIKRMNLLLPHEAHERLNEMRNLTEVRYNGDVIRNSLRFYDWFVDQQIKENVVEIEQDMDQVFKRIDSNTKVTYRLQQSFYPQAWMRFEELRKKSEATDNEGTYIGCFKCLQSIPQAKIARKQIKSDREKWDS